MNILDVALAGKIAASGGGGTDDYNDLLHLPQINGVTLSGDKTPESLGLQGELTFDTEPTEDSTNPVESGGVYSKLAKKQDNLTFDGTYDASTNKAATESTVTNAINELDVSATSFDANETISSISETDGKVSVTKQDIAIASNQVVAMTGYAKPSSAPANPAIQTNDTANQAFGKLEFKADTNQTNILLVQDATKELVDKGAKNLVDFSNLVSLVTQHATVTKTDTTITVSSTDTWGYQSYLLNLPAGKYELSFNATAVSISSGTMFIAVFPGQTATDQLVRVDATSIGAKHGSFEWTGGELNISFYANPSNTQIINSMTITDVMICTEADWKVSQNYVPFALPNTDLTYREQQDRNALVEVINKGAKNKFDFSNSTIVREQYTTTTKSNDNLVVSCTGAVWAFASLAAGKFTGNCTFTFIISELSNSGASPYVRFTKNQDGSSPILDIAVAANGTYTANFVGDGSDYYICIYLNPSATSQTVSLKMSDIMISTPAEYKISPSYQPYVMTNAELTQKKAPALNATGYVTSGSLDDITTNTFTVYGSSVVNIPVSDGSWFYVETIIYNANNALQKAYNFMNGTSYIRVKDSGTWGNWKQITNA